MTQWHLKSDRKVSGGFLATMRRSDKRLAWKGGDASNTTIAESEENIDRKVAKALGGSTKVKVRAERTVNVNAEGKVRALEIVTVAENKANRQFARNNIMTKGAVLEVRDGDAKAFVRVTNRPGQDGIIYGIKLHKFVKEKDLKAENTDKAEKKRKIARKTPKKAKEEPKTEKK